MGCDTAYKTRRGINTSFNPRTRMGCDKGIAFPALGLSVSIHAPAWGATRTSTTSKSMRPFQSTHPHGVRHGWNVETVKHILFQSTHPHGVRHNLTVCKTAHPLFQSTHPHGVRQRTPGGFYTLFCFNPRTRMGCDCRGRLERPKGHVSIHAPARGATKLGRRSTVCWRFQSTHPHGVRPRTGFGRRIGKRFNPRTRTGCDKTCNYAASFVHGFNPRTRTGCDASKGTIGSITDSFNPRTRTGCDHRRRSYSPRLPRFQSTHPHGVRLVDCKSVSSTLCFNPRTRTGCDRRSAECNYHSPCFNPRTRTGCD